MSSGKSNRELRVELNEVIAHLHHLQSALAVAVGALREQNADIDADIASLLRTSVRDPLQRQIERLERLARHLHVSPAPAPSPRKPARLRRRPTRR